jgi:hypothetical protein
LRAAAFVEGLAVTVNGCVSTRGCAIGAPMVQLTGEPELTPHALGSCGNDWTAAAELGLASGDLPGLARRVGVALAEEGYRGIFGVDAVIRPSGEAVLIEANPRLVASIAMHTQLELDAGVEPLLARHLAAFLDPASEPPIDEAGPALRGGQIILHNTAPRPLSVGRRLRAGVYAYGSDHRELAFRRPGLTPVDLGPGEVIVLPTGDERPVEPGAECGRLQTADRVADASGRLTSAAGALAAAVRRSMGLVGPPDAPPASA